MSITKFSSKCVMYLYVTTVAPLFLVVSVIDYCTVNCETDTAFSLSSIEV